MGKADRTKSGSKELLIEIETFEQSYHIADHRAELGRVDDEAIIDIRGTVVRSSDRRRPLDGKPVEASLICSNSYCAEEQRLKSDVPMLMAAQLTEGVFRLVAYLPPSPFWAIPNMITTRRATHILADYQVWPRGYSMLGSLYFAPKTSIDRQGLCP